jgi:three-Cys-motif partner protein
MKSFGGNWTEQKLNAFIKYVKAYLTIMNRYKWETIYFDGFAGSGKRVVYQTDETYLPNLSGEKEELFVYEGSVTRILKLKNPFIFDWYYFVDTNKNYVSKLKEIRRDISHIAKERIIIREDNCNSQLEKLANGLKSNTNYASLLFLDPYGMQIDWNSIYRLKDTRSDVWLLIPSGVGVNRLLDKKKRLEHKEKLEKFFGLSIAEIEKIFYISTNEDTLFGMKEMTNKIGDPIDQIVKIYIRQMKSVWRYVTEKPLVLMNSRNIPIFHFLFASNNKIGLKIASEIIYQG